MKTVEEFQAIQKKQLEIFQKKHQDYGSSSVIGATDLNKPDNKLQALCSCVFRIKEKVFRLLNLIWKKRTLETTNEKIEDTYLDIANYCIISLLILTDKWKDDE